MIKTVKKGFRAFFDYSQDEELVVMDVAKKVSFLTIGRVLYGIGDWVIAAGLGSLSFWMQGNGFSLKEVLVMTIVYDFIASAAFFYASDVTECDFTLGQSFRRLAESLHQEGFWGRLSAAALLLYVSVKAIVWEGPEVICFLFQKELKSKKNTWIALFVLSAIQGVFGTWLYTTGYQLWSTLGEKVTAHTVLLGAATFFIFVLVSMLVGWLMKNAFVAIKWLYVTDGRMAAAAFAIWLSVIAFSLWR
jgi:hypothetical protein